MSHSTTATSTYVLTKYSKSYPSAQSNPHDIAELNTVEWQHFTNPTINLVLDIKKGTELESVRLRILWLMADSTNRSGQREVVFEDIDLLSLSCIPQRRIQRQSMAPGLPLKAVYRDTIVGIRYLHSPDANNEPGSVYRRFQITFLSSSAVSEFIDAIKTICPCKANPSTIPIRKVINPPLTTANTNSTYSQNCGGAPGYVSRTLNPPASFSISQSAVPDSQVPFPSSQNFVLATSPMDSRSSIYTSSPLNLDTNSALPALSSLPPTLVCPPGFNGSDFSAHPAGTLSQHSGVFPQLQGSAFANKQNQLSLPSSSPPTSITTSTTKDVNGILPTVLHDDDNTAPAILASLRETTTLYDLPMSTLEQVVGDVVREEGFTKLLENLNAMWRVKSFMGI